jgi:hypothetical protein
MTHPSARLNATASSSTAHLGATDNGVRHRTERTERGAGIRSQRSGSEDSKDGKRRRTGGVRAVGGWAGKKMVIAEGFRQFGEHCARNQVS